jgi:hypothetical protein
MGFFFVATFMMVLLYWFNPEQPAWLFLYINGLSLFALIWSIPRVIFKNRGRILLPTSFESMLIALVWFVPLVLGPAIGIDEEQQMKITWACVQALPILMLFKLSVRRHARRNHMVAIGFILVLAMFGISSFI